MRAHIATESRHRDSTATAAGPESRRAYQPSAPATGDWLLEKIGRLVCSGAAYMMK